MNETVPTKEVVKWIDTLLEDYKYIPVGLRKDLNEAKRVWSQEKQLQKRYNSTHKTPLASMKQPYSTTK